MKNVDPNCLRITLSYFNIKESAVLLRVSKDISAIVASVLSTGEKWRERLLIPDQGQSQVDAIKSFNDAIIAKVEVNLPRHSVPAIQYHLIFVKIEELNRKDNFTHISLYKYLMSFIKNKNHAATHLFIQAGVAQFSNANRRRLTGKIALDQAIEQNNISLICALLKAAHFFNESHIRKLVKIAEKDPQILDVLMKVPVDEEIAKLRPIWLYEAAVDRAILTGNTFILEKLINDKSPIPSSFNPMVDRRLLDGVRVIKNQKLFDLVFHHVIGSELRTINVDLLKRDRILTIVEHDYPVCTSCPNCMQSVHLNNPEVYS